MGCENGRTVEGCPADVEGVAQDLDDDAASDPRVTRALDHHGPQIIEDGGDPDGRDGADEQVGAMGAAELARRERQQAPLPSRAPVAAGQAVGIAGQGPIEGGHDLLVQRIQLTAERAQRELLSAVAFAGHEAMLAPSVTRDEERRDACVRGRASLVSSTVHVRETAIVSCDLEAPSNDPDEALAIDVRDLRHAYGRVQAVAGISFQVLRGEVFALLGPNGAGKTTTVEILEGYRAADAGSISVLGFDPWRGGSAYRERIGIVLQTSGVYPYMTGREALVLHAGYYPSPRDPAEILELVGLTEHAGVLVRKLSGGQLRRLDVALALVGGPDLIFLDEPTTGFDPAARRSFWRVLSQLASEGTTILLTTHYMEEATALADRVAVVSHGRIVATGPPGALASSVMQTTRIAFRPPPGVDEGDLAAVLGVPVARGEDLLHVDVDRPTETLYALTSWARARGVELDALRVAPPTLEDAFLALTASPERS